MCGCISCCFMHFSIASEVHCNLHQVFSHSNMKQPLLHLTFKMYNIASVRTNLILGWNMAFHYNITYLWRKHSTPSIGMSPSHAVPVSSLLTNSCLTFIMGELWRVEADFLVRCVRYIHLYTDTAIYTS